MRKICKEKLKLERFELPREEALKFMEEREEPYKVELINDLPADAHISFYKQGEFTGPVRRPPSGLHRPHQGQRHQADRLQRRLLAGRQQPPDPPAHLRRGLPQKEELDAYLKEREEALKRDHNKLGRELEYFTTVDCIGQGLPILLPKGARVIQLLQRWVEDEGAAAGLSADQDPP